jgi:hypothetical protein
VPIGIQFTEPMRGHYSTAVVDDYANAEARGKQDGATFEFTVTVSSDNLEPDKELGVRWPPLPSTQANPVGIDGVLEGLCPPYVKPEQHRHQAAHAAAWGER